MRCCTGSLAEALYPDGPAQVAKEGDVFECKYANGDPSHRMRFRDGAWEWDHD
jgi:hypothetical protein